MSHSVQTKNNELYPIGEPVMKRKKSPIGLGKVMDNKLFCIIVLIPKYYFGNFHGEVTLLPNKGEFSPSCGSLMWGRPILIVLSTKHWLSLWKLQTSSLSILKELSTSPLPTWTIAISLCIDFFFLPNYRNYLNQMCNFHA